jgi:hypothetical protein
MLLNVSTARDRVLRATLRNEKRVRSNRRRWLLYISHIHRRGKLMQQSRMRSQADEGVGDRTDSGMRRG